MTSIDISKSNIASLEVKTQERIEEDSETMSTLLLDSFLAFANQAGILHIMKIFS